MRIISERPSSAPLTASTTSKAELRDILAQVKRDGLAVTINETAEGVTGFSAPILDASGSAIAAIVVGAPSERVADRRETIAGLVHAAGRTISLSLGFSGY